MGAPDENGNLPWRLATHDGMALGFRRRELGFAVSCFRASPIGSGQFCHG